MQRWLIANISHFAVPLTLLLSSFSIYVGWTTRKRMRNGLPVKSNRLLLGIGFLLICCSCLLLGIMFTRL